MVRTLAGRNPQYFEAILQLRECSPAAVNFAEKEMGAKKIPLAKKVTVKNGFDYYLADKDFTKALGKKLQEQFGGELNTTASIFGRKDGKDLYRLTILFRGISFKKGDFVEYKGENYKVVLVGRDILLQDVKTGGKVHVWYKDIKRK
ncbi:MAG: NMD3-related protein [Nanoarchaeota archaeon]